MRTLITALLCLALTACTTVGESTLPYRLLVANYLENNPERLPHVEQAVANIQVRLQDNPDMAVATLRREFEASVINWQSLTLLQQEALVEMLDYMQRRAEQSDMPERVALRDIVTAIELQVARYSAAGYAPPAD